MTTPLRSFFAPPIYDDPERNQQARFLNTILLSFVAANIIMAIPILLASDNPLPGLLADGIALLLWSIFRYILKRGHLRTASILTISGAWLLQTTLLFFLDALNRPIFAIYFLIIISAATILGRRASYIVAGATAIAAIGAYIANNQGILPPPIITTSPLSGLVQNILFLFVAAIIMALAVRSLNEALEQFRQSEKAQQAAIQELQTVQSTLHEKVDEKTASLERRSLLLQTAAEVGHATTIIHDIDELIVEAVHLISERFDFYHATIYLLEGQDEYLLLKAASSKEGQRMLSQGHRIAINKESIVGYAASQREARIALDIELDSAYANNEYLPETRSEMALPLVAKTHLLGVLDVQSKREAAFTEEDIAVLEILANQIAVSIRNARLFSEHDKALATVRQAYGQLSQEGWVELLRERPELSFLATATESAENTSEAWTAGMEKARTDAEINIIDDQTIAIPVILRNQSLGVVRLKKFQGSPPWSKDEIELMDTLTDQLEVALESARLFDQSQRRTARERVIGETSARIRETLDIESVLETAAQELHKILGKVETEVWIDAE